jgi:two-component system, cell cycle sensor histidine kinase and response regulator CckA
VQPFDGSGKKLNEEVVPGVAGTCVLIVDDDEQVLNLICRWAITHGFCVLRSRCGRKALSILQTYSPKIDILLTDVNMPGMSGPELARGAVAFCPEMRVLYMSGGAGEAVSSGQIRYGERILSKPFSSTTLLQELQRVAERNGEGGA